MTISKPEKRTSALCVLHGALVLCEFTKHRETYVNPLGEERKRDLAKCPQCKRSSQFEGYDTSWLRCADGDCDFLIDRRHYEEMTAWFNHPDHDVDEYLESIRIVPIGEQSW